MHHILLIDTNTFFAATLAGLLRRTGYRVTVEESLEKGGNIHAHDPAALVLLGVYLDQVPIRRYLRSIRRTFAGAAILALLSERDHSSRHYPLLLAELGHDHIVQKPFRTEDLLASIHRQVKVVARRAG